MCLLSAGCCLTLFHSTYSIKNQTNYKHVRKWPAGLMSNSDNMNNLTVLNIPYVLYALLFLYLVLVFFPAFFNKFMLFVFRVKDHHGNVDHVQTAIRVNGSIFALSWCVSATSRNSTQFGFSQTNMFICILKVQFRQTDTINRLFLTSCNILREGRQHRPLIEQVHCG